MNPIITALPLPWESDNILILNSYSRQLLLDIAIDAEGVQTPHDPYPLISCFPSNRIQRPRRDVFHSNLRSLDDREFSIMVSRLLRRPEALWLPMMLKERTGF